MNRRRFLAALAAGAVVTAEGLWVPGRKFISIPKPRPLPDYDIFARLLDTVADDAIRRALLYAERGGLVAMKAWHGAGKMNAEYLPFRRLYVDGGTA